jgi:hypothetical protein
VEEGFRVIEKEDWILKCMVRKLVSGRGIWEGHGRKGGVSCDSTRISIPQRKLGDTRLPYKTHTLSLLKMPPPPLPLLAATTGIQTRSSYVDIIRVLFKPASALGNRTRPAPLSLLPSVENIRGLGVCRSMLSMLVVGLKTGG